MTNITETQILSGEITGPAKAQWLLQAFVGCALEQFVGNHYYVSANETQTADFAVTHPDRFERLHREALRQADTTAAELQAYVTGLETTLTAIEQTSEQPLLYALPIAA